MGEPPADKPADHLAYPPFSARPNLVWYWGEQPPARVDRRRDPGRPRRRGTARGARCRLPWRPRRRPLLLAADPLPAGRDRRVATAPPGDVRHRRARLPGRHIPGALPLARAG